MNTYCSSKYYLLLFHLIVSNILTTHNGEPTNYSKNIELVSSNLPLISINTSGQAIVDEERIIAHMGIIYNGEGNRNFLTDDYNDYDGLIAIELRGSSSLGYPKPQYRFETQDSLGENLNVSLCGLPRENDWILNGPYNDKSLIRNVFAYKLSNQLGRYAARTVYCELFVNEEYLGLYILMEKIKRDNDRIDISTLTELDNSADELTGGYIVKIDKLDGENVDFWLSSHGTQYQYHYPKPDEITEQQKNYIQNYFSEFEEIMISTNYNDPVSGYKNFIDVDSFVDHFILNEFCKNVDAYRLSAFLYKDKNSVNPKLIAGPIWDFNLTFGDAWIEEEINFSDGWQVDYTVLHPDDIFRVPFWWGKLSRDWGMANKIKIKWFALRESLFSMDSLFNQIDNLVDYISESKERNFQRWPEVLPYPYDQEIIRLKGWIIRRLDWIDNNLDKLTDVKVDNQNNLVNRYILSQNYPNPFNPATTIKYSIPTLSRPSPYQGEGVREGFFVSLKISISSEEK